MSLERQQTYFSMSQGLADIFELMRSLCGQALWDDSYLHEEARLLLADIFELTRSLHGLALWDDSYLREEARLL